MQRPRFLAFLGALVLVLATLAGSLRPVRAASLVEVSNFGANPGSLRMYLYVPNSVAARPAILVAAHPCGGSGPGFFSSSEFAGLADRFGFIVIYPSATRFSNCFDVSSPETLRHDGGSDPVSVVSMVRYVVQNRSGDPNRVYVTGSSSGGLFTNVLLGSYPDVFKAGAAFMGAPFGCLAGLGSSPTRNVCSNGTLIKTPQQWGDLVRAAYPGYTGPRPRMQIWHGTQDPVINYANFNEEIKQWTNVLGVSQTPVLSDRPRSNWARTRYGSSGLQAPVEAISVENVGHSLPMSGMAALAITFFGLDGASPTPTSTPIVTPTPVTPTPVTPTPVTPTPGTPTPTTLPTPTPTPGSGACSPVTGTVTAPFSYDGAGTFCWQIANIPNYINSWNLTSLKINGVDFSNIYAVPSNLPPKINGYWYVSYSGAYPWSHFEAR
jgi:poly(hydroxyalkanoate) depolymerase family esterase